MDLVVAYDIADTDGDGARRLREVAHICESYGRRVQYSVFEFHLSETRLARLIGQLADAIDPAQDSILVYRFPGSLADSRTGLGRPAFSREVDGPWIL